MKTFVPTISNAFLSPLLMFEPNYLHRGFTSCVVRYQRPDHRLYKQIDWSLVEGGKYAVVDPLDPSNILYLSPREYLTAQRTWISNDVAVVVLATPKDTPLTASSSDLKNSPPRTRVPGLEHLGPKAARGRLWGMFESSLKKFINYRLQSKRAPDETGVYALLPQPVVEIHDGNIKDLILSWGHDLQFKLFGLATGRGLNKALEAFAQHTRDILVHEGPLQLVKRMKIYALAVKAYLAGTPYQSTNDLGVRVRLSHGLPTCLPSPIRSALRSKTPPPYRFWISLLHSYKAMVTPRVKPDLSGVVSTPPELDPKLFAQFEAFQAKYVSVFKPARVQHGSEPSFALPGLHWAKTSGPNARPAYAGIRQDLVAWILQAAHKLGWAEDLREKGQAHLYLADIIARWRVLVSPLQGLSLKMARRQVPLLKFLVDFTEDSPKLWALLRDSTLGLAKDLGVETFSVDKLDGPLKHGVLKEVHPDLKILISPGKGGRVPVLIPRHEKTHLTSLARLCFLSEPAGKVRNIVIMDWWSQQFLKPVHDWMFGMLRFLPTDATFDQEGALKDFAVSARENEIFSYDLKSATEMISQSLYVTVMTEFWGRLSAKAWMELLVDRWFQLQPMEGLAKADQPIGPVRYRRGQPMGALSSWASMALVHHSLVQFAAFRVGKFPFWNYRVLGDDIVIAGRSIAESYLEVCSGLGIPISLAKSLSSKNGVFDFASQIMRWRANFSPISLREELASSKPGRRLEYGLRQARRGIIDLNSPGWFSQFLRFILPRSVYTDIVEGRRLGVLDPAARVVLMELLGTLDLKASRLGLELPKVSCWSQFLGLCQGKVAFRESLKTYLGLGRETAKAEARELTLEALVYQANYVYRKFLGIRPFIERCEDAFTVSGALSLSGVRSLLDSSREYYAPPLFHLWAIADKVERFREWETKYRRVLKTITVAGGLRPMPLELFEYTLEDSLENLWEIVQEADRSLLVTPEALLGEGALPDEIDILVPSDNELRQQWCKIRRLSGWTDLLDIAVQNRVHSLGLPGPDTGWR